MTRLKRAIFAILFITCFVVAVIFAGDNSQQVSLQFLGTELLSLPFALWLVLAFVAGAILVLLFLLPVMGAHRAQIRRLKRHETSPARDETRDG